MTDNEQVLLDFTSKLGTYLSDLITSHSGLYALVAEHLPNLNPEVRAELTALSKNIANESKNLKEISSQLSRLMK
jgi:hypothetical protein